MIKLEFKTFLCTNCSDKLLKCYFESFCKHLDVKITQFKNEINESMYLIKIPIKNPS